MGAFKAILDILITYLIGNYIYKSYSTFVSRHIQVDLQKKQADQKEQRKID